MSLSACDTLRGSFSGHNGAGSISLPGARVGDVAVNIYVSYPADSYWGAFESVVSVDDQIQQLGSQDFTPYTFQITLVRPIAVS